MKIFTFWGLLGTILLASCHPHKQKEEVNMQEEHKIVVYQVFTRLFGNTNTNNKPWGTIEENGVGKFSDFSPEALKAIKDLGVSHIWYTGVLHHAMVTDYSEIGIPGDDPDVVKGRAGSPYSVKDYYNVNPDLATDPAHRLEEFEDLVDRTHAAGLKVIIDIVPNHVARVYHSVTNPEGVEDFGASDNTAAVYARDNNFYYVTGKAFRVPEWRDGYQVLGGEDHPGADRRFEENPAKWTGNGSRSAQPDMNDWYEAVKVNFGIRPDGSKDFDELPDEYAQHPYQMHYAFWKERSVPDSWSKFRDIALYWIDKGVDGFRYDMAEMVPVEFWSYLNSAIKTARPDAFLLAEIYQPRIYSDYINLGKMDYLYDKVDLYDTLKNIIQGHGSTDNIIPILKGQADIEQHMLHFLENHDEQRIASTGFAGNALRGKPAMVLSSTIGTSPTMIYFAQELGEAGEGDAGFGSATRTTIFDYWGIPSQARWINNGKYDGGMLTDAEKDLRAWYRKLLNFTLKSRALTGEFREIHSYNRAHTEWYNDRIFSYVRWKDGERLIIMCNFSYADGYGFQLELPREIIEAWNLEKGNYALRDQLGKRETFLRVIDGRATVRIDLEPMESLILKLD